MTGEQKREWVRNTVIPAHGGRGGLSTREQERLLQMEPEEAIQDLLFRQENSIRAYQEQATSARAQAAEIEEVEQHIQTPDKYARTKVYDSYAEMGIDAMKVTQERKLDKPVYIGPELGWAVGPQGISMYGGHPEEFIELITKSRDVMAQKLKAQGYDLETAKEKAKQHIKGMVDTSHMATWFKHFKKENGETDEKHLKRFNEWMKDEAKAMVKAGVVGGVQVVDSITGEHAHLPAGQGAFQVADVVRAMKEAGFNGPIIAEGHEEEQFGAGRILTESWRAFGSPIRSVGPGRAGLGAWGGMQSSYFGHTMPTTYVVGGYAPSNDWSFWSETPFE